MTVDEELSKVEVHHHWRVVTACRYALLVEVLDVPHDPMAADPDRIEAPWVARRVLPPPRPVGDAKRPGRLASPKPVHLIGMKSEPAAQRVIEIVRLVRADQKIIPKLTLQFPVAGMPVRPGISEVECVNQRRVGVCSEQQRPILCRQPRSEGNRLA